MKILIINQSDIDGGAARATYRIASGLVNKNINVNMLVMRKLGFDKWVIGPNSIFSYLVLRCFPRLDWISQILLGVRKGFSWSLNLLPNPLLDEIFFNQFDVVHLNWIGKNMIPIQWLEKIKSPIIWTLHDSWAFTGGCHVPFSCDRFKEACGNCPQLMKPNINDVSNSALMKKISVYKGLKIHFVAPSNWMAQHARLGAALSNMPVTVIPNGLDTNLYKPYEKLNSRELLSLPKNKFIILFGAMNAHIDPNKGLDLFFESMEIFANENSSLSKDCCIVVFGVDKSKLPEFSAIPIHSLGVIKNDIQLARIYSSADLTVMPSRSESFGQVALESISCGIPVVCFKTTGLIDIVEHLKTGYLAECFNTTDLARGIKLMLSNPILLKEMSTLARLKAVEIFDINVISTLYANLYAQVSKV